MNVEKIRELRLADPFRQFYIVFSDGRKVLVDQPYHLGIAPDGSHLLISPRDGSTQRFTIEQMRELDILPQRVA